MELKILEEHLKELIKEDEHKQTHSIEVKRKSEFLGSKRRKEAQATILQICKELLPIDYNTAIKTIAYRTGLSCRKVDEDYIDMFITMDILTINKNTRLLELGVRINDA